MVYVGLPMLPLIKISPTVNHVERDDRIANRLVRQNGYLISLIKMNKLQLQDTIQKYESVFLQF